MKRFVKLQFQDFMDMKPSLDVRPFEGDSLEDIESKAKAFVAHMKKMPWSGTSRYLGIMDRKEADAFIKEQIKKECLKFQDDSLEFINRITKSYLDCYEEVSDN